MAIALLIDDNPISLPESLELAKKLAEPFIVEKKKVSIECGSTVCGSTVAPMQKWNYCYQEQDWVEQQ